MRLNSAEIERLVAVLDANVPSGILCDARLFGSRLDDHVRGGDVDLYIEVSGLDPPAVAALQRHLRPLLEEAIDLPVDLILHSQGEPLPLIARIAKEKGICLVGKGKKDAR